VIHVVCESRAVQYVAAAVRIDQKTGGDGSVREIDFGRPKDKSVGKPGEPRQVPGEYVTAKSGRSLMSGPAGAWGCVHLDDTRCIGRLPPIARNNSGERRTAFDIKSVMWVEEDHRRAALPGLAGAEGACPVREDGLCLKLLNEHFRQNRIRHVKPRGTRRRDGLGGDGSRGLRLSQRILDVREIVRLIMPNVVDLVRRDDAVDRRFT